MRRKKKTRIKKSTLAITAFFIALATLLIISLLISHHPESSQNLGTGPPAREYFKIGKAFAIVTYNDSQVLKVKSLTFNITPIKGNATEVHIDPGGGIDWADWPYFKFIECNHTVSVEIEYKTPKLAYKKENGYEITVRLWCYETSWELEEQRVTIYIEDWSSLY